MNVVSLSGGKDSTAMLLMMIGKKINIDKIILVDTTKEFPQMYRHIEKLKKIIYPYEIEILKIDLDYWMMSHIKTKGKNKGKSGYGWPDFRIRWCTALKIEAISKVLYSDDVFEPKKRGMGRRIKKDIIEFHGIASNEKNRLLKNNDGRNIKTPLFDWGITEKDALKYCYNKGLDWEGLYEKFQRVSCWCCPLSRIGELRTLYNDFPKLYEKLIEMDKKSYRKFRSDYSLEELTVKFANENL